MIVKEFEKTSFSDYTDKKIQKFCYNLRKAEKIPKHFYESDKKDMSNCLDCFQKTLDLEIAQNKLKILLKEKNEQIEKIEELKKKDPFIYK